MEKTIHRAEGRGFSDNGWMKTYSSFSFGYFYDPHRINFGSLRALNEIEIMGGEGLKPHPHDNMEVVFLPIEGAIERGDNLGHNRTVGVGEVEVMSAGTGMVHNKYNKSRTDSVKYLQFWVFPREYEMPPKCEKTKLETPDNNKLQLIVSPEGGEGVGCINQDAWFYRAKLDPGVTVTHTLNREGNGVYIFVLEGSVSVAGSRLGPRDGVGLEDLQEVDIKANASSRIILIDLPMKKKR